MSLSTLLFVGIVVPTARAHPCAQGRKIPPEPSAWRDAETGEQGNLWLNLSDGFIGGGRRNWDGTGGSGSALRHFQDMQAQARTTHTHPPPTHPCTPTHPIHPSTHPVHPPIHPHPHTHPMHPAGQVLPARREAGHHHPARRRRLLVRPGRGRHGRGPEPRRAPRPLARRAPGGDGVSVSRTLASRHSSEARAAGDWLRAMPIVRLSSVMSF